MPLGQCVSVQVYLRKFRYGGRIIGGFCPYNYSEDVWVKASDRTAVYERFELFKNGCDPLAVVSLIEERRVFA